MTDTELRIRAPLQGRSRRSFEKVLDAAAVMLAEEGYDQLTLAGVSQRSGVSIGSIYARVKSKEDLLDAVQMRILERVEDAQAALLAEMRSETLEFDALVMTLVGRLGDFLQAHADLLRPLMTRASADAHVSGLGKQGHQKLEQGFAEVLLRHRERIGHPEPERAVRASFAITYAAYARYLGLGSSLEAAGEGDWATLKEDLGRMTWLFLASDGSRPA